MAVLSVIFFVQAKQQNPGNTLCIAEIFYEVFAEKIRFKPTHLYLKSAFTGGRPSVTGDLVFDMKWDKKESGTENTEYKAENILRLCGFRSITRQTAGNVDRNPTIQDENRR